MELDPAEAGITALAVAPSGSLAAVGGAAGGVKLVNLPKGDTVGKLEGHGEGESVEALVFVDLLAGAGGGKGVVLVSGGTDGKGFVWDVATGRVRAEIKHDVSAARAARAAIVTIPLRLLRNPSHPSPHTHRHSSTSSPRHQPTGCSRPGTSAPARSSRNTRAMRGSSTA
jgi:ribosome assembly protein SQT1